MNLHAQRSKAAGQSDEASLVDAARHGDEAAIRELIRRLNPRLFRVARGIVESDAEAEEVVQDTYLAAFAGLAAFRGEARFSTWITRIALNTAKMRQRRAKPQEEYDTVDEDTTPPRVIAFPCAGFEPAETALGRTQMRGLLESALSELPSDLRLPFLLHEAEGMSLAEIAVDLDLIPATLRTRLFRARRRLRTILEERLRGGFETVFPFDGQRCVDMADRVVARLQAAGVSGNEEKE